ncbi:MAG: hypothetical protein LC117_03585 [Bacteroidia bacterium]|nr:hypothetical protein [Bacteroidia bacterium]MCZ2276995.1 hypothetical protein [Bacteroidia bacterium]
MKNKKLLFGLIIVAVLLWVGELLVDQRFGDGDGIISRYKIHTLILIAQLILLSIAGIVVINYIYIILLRGKAGSRSILWVAGKVFFVLLIALIVLLLTELTLRILVPSEGTFDMMYPVENARSPYPYSMFKGKPGTPTGYGYELYNLHGYRGKFPDFGANKNEFRIVLLGGSAVWEGDTTLAEFLESYLKLHGQSHASVYNMGVVAANSSMEVVTLLNEVLGLQPNVVIFYDGANDIIHPLHYDPRPGFPFNFLVYEHNPFLDKSFPVWLLMAYKSQIFRVIAKHYLAERITLQKSLRTSSGYLTEAWRKKIIRIYHSNHQMALNLCHNHGIKFFSVLQPVVYSKQIFSREETEFVKVRDQEREHVTELLKLIRNKFEADSLLNQHYLDLTSVFGVDSVLVFRDNVHMNNSGRKRVAEEIGKKLLNTGMLN